MTILMEIETTNHTPIKTAVTQYDTNGSRAQRRYAARAAAGLCRRCGKGPPKTGRTRCGACAEEDKRIGRECNKRTNKAKNYYRKTRLKYRDWYYRRKYGITLVRYQEMLRSQDGRCAVCRRSPKENRALDVDHCHKTGALRGLLCASCNTAIGHLREDRKFFMAALQYLKRTTNLRFKSERRENLSRK